MKLLTAILTALWCFSFAALAAAQQQPPPEPPSRVEAKREVIVNWSLGDQAWDFRDIRTAYEPIKGYLEPVSNRAEPGVLAVWKLRLVKDFEEGTVKLHEEIPGSPFKVVLLDADRTIINPDLPAQITVVPSKMDDTIELYVGLPDAPVLKQVKTIRLQRRTDVGF